MDQALKYYNYWLQNICSWAVQHVVFYSCWARTSRSKWKEVESFKKRRESLTVIRSILICVFLDISKMVSEDIKQCKQWQEEVIWWVAHHQIQRQTFKCFFSNFVVSLWQRWRMTHREINNINRSDRCSYFKLTVSVVLCMIVIFPNMFSTASATRQLAQTAVFHSS